MVIIVGKPPFLKGGKLFLEKMSKGGDCQKKMAEGKKQKGGGKLLFPLCPGGEMKISSTIIFLLIDEMKGCLSLLARKWMVRGDGVEQLEVINQVLSGPDCGIQYPNAAYVLLILLATSGNTSSVERSFTYLEMICAPRRNCLSPEHLETLYMLANLKIPVKDTKFYTNEIIYGKQLLNFYHVDC